MTSPLRCRFAHRTVRCDAGRRGQYTRPRLTPLAPTSRRAGIPVRSLRSARGTTMAEQRPPRSHGTRDYFDRAAANVPQFTVLNYGFSSEPENSVISSAEPEFYCLRLYEHALAATPL